MTRTISWLIAGLTLGLNCGCSTPSEQYITLRVANWGGVADDSEFSRTVQEIYDEFERQNPGIRIQIEGIPGSNEYVSKILLSHVARAAPDVLALDASSSAAFIEYGVLQDLTPHISSDPNFDLSDYYPNVVGIARRGDHIFAIPMDFTPMVMYYNKDLFDRAGVPYPRPGWTRDEFLSIAKKLTTKDQYGFKFSNWMPGWIMWMWNGGGDVIEPIRNDQDSAINYKSQGVFDSQLNQDTVKFLTDLVTLHRVAPSLSATAAQGIDPFANGKAAMEISGHWALIGYAKQSAINVDRIGVIELPSELERSQTVMYEAGLAIGKHCRYPDAAWKFIKYMASADVQRKYHQTGVAISARRDISSERATDERERTFLEIVPSARAPWGSRVLGYNLVEDIGQKAFDGIFKNGLPVEPTLKSAAREIESELNRK